MVARAVLIVAALVVAALLAVSLRAVRLEAQARDAIPDAGLPPDVVARADRLLQRAARHNPDTRPEIGRSLLLGAAGDYRTAAEILRGVVRREPENLRAAVALAGALTRLGAPDAAEARRRVLELAPPVR